MVEGLNPDDLEESSGAKENFIGRVIDSSVDGLAEKAKEAGYSDGSSEYESDIDHFMFIQPLTVYEKPQSELSLNVSNDPKSKWVVMMMHLREIHGEEVANAESLQDVLDLMHGNVYEFRDITWTEDEPVPVIGESHGVTYKSIGRERDPNSMLVPVREVTDEAELADIDAEVDTGGVEEMEL